MNRSNFGSVFEFKSTSVVVIKYKDRYLKAHRDQTDFFAKADGDIIESSTQWIVELVDDEELDERSSWFFKQFEHHTTTRIRLKNCKYGKYIRMYDSYRRGDGLVQLSPYSIPPLSTQIIFMVYPTNNTNSVVLRNNDFISINKYDYVSSTAGYCEEKEKYEAASKFIFYVDNKPFSADQHPEGILMHNLDFFTHVYNPMKVSQEPDVSTLLLHDKKKRFTPDAYNFNLKVSMMQFEREIDGAQWEKYKKYFYTFRNQVDRLQRNKRFYDENEYDELLRLVVYGLFHILSVAPRVSFSSSLNISDEKICEMVGWSLTQFETEFVSFYKLVCGEGIVEWLKLKNNLKYLSLKEKDMDWKLMSAALKERDINAINLQLLTRSDWKCIVPFVSEHDQDVIFNATQELLCKYPETSMFYQRKQNENIQNEPSSFGLNGWIMAAILIVVAVYYKVFHQ
eukprot:285700_1